MNKILNIDISDYTLSAVQIDNLASEYYGRVLPLTNDDGSKEMEIEFSCDDYTPQVLCGNFMTALNNFKDKKD